MGSLPFGYLVGRSRGVNILEQGSGNIGATNVGRVLGRGFGVLVFLLDFSKGAVPTSVGLWVGNTTRESVTPEFVAAGAGLAAFLGHLFPVYLRFRGGKGVATGSGVVAVLVPGPLLLAALVWFVFLCLTCYMSLASLLAGVALCAVRVALTPDPFGSGQWIRTAFCFVAATLVFVRHHENLRRLWTGTERRLPEGPTMIHAGKVIHVLGVALWFGGGVFFTFVAAPVIFQSFEALAAPENADRPSWLPEPFARERGTQLAGLAVGPIFPWYYLIQGVCGVLALAPAWRWCRLEPLRQVHRIRFAVLVLAFVTVLIGWPLAQHVSALRADRYGNDPARATAARAEFATWHLYSLFLNMGTVALVGVATGLAASLPPTPPRKPVAPAAIA